MAIIQNLKNSVYLAIKIRNILVVNSSASGGFALPPGSAPGPRWGTSVPQAPSDLLPPGQIPSYATAKLLAEIKSVLSLTRVSTRKKFSVALVQCNLQHSPCSVWLIRTLKAAACISNALLYTLHRPLKFFGDGAL